MSSSPNGSLSTGTLRTGTLLAGLLLMGGCDGGFFAPGAPTLPGHLDLSLSLAGLADEVALFEEVFGKADAVSLRLSVGGQVEVDTVVAVDPSQEIRVLLPVRPGSGTSSHLLEAALRRGADDLFRGSVAFSLAPNRTNRVEVPLTPIPAAVRLPPQVPLFTAIGDSHRVEAEVTFATGDPIPSLPLTWSSSNPSVATVDGTGLVVSTGEGTAQIQASHEGLQGSVPVEVRAEVAAVEVEPAADTIFLQETRLFQAQVLDRNGNLLERTPTWGSSNPNVAVVDAVGLAVAVGLGTAQIIASSEGVSGSGSLTVFRGGEEVFFPDPALEAAVREALQIPEMPIFDGDMEQLAELNAQGVGIQDLTGLEFAVNLRTLRLPQNRITGVDPLSGLSRLTTLVLTDNFIATAAPLEGLEELSTLELGGNQIVDAAPLGGLLALRTLGLRENPLAGIGELAELSGLRTLDLSGVELADFTPLANLFALRDLSLARTGIQDLVPLRGLLNLTRLQLQTNEIFELQPLLDNQGLGPGDEVDLRENPLSSFALCSQVPTLQERGVLVDVSEPCLGRTATGRLAYTAP